jgi:hypothetical protein
VTRDISVSALEWNLDHVYHSALYPKLYQNSRPTRLTKNDDEPTSFTPVGISAGSPEPSLRPSPATGHNAEILGVYDPDLGYDAEIFHISSPHGGLDLHFAQGYWEGYVDTFVRQEA